jgi:hypothetical protein
MTVTAQCISRQKFFDGSRFRRANLRRKGEEGKRCALQLRLLQFPHPVAQQVLFEERDGNAAKKTDAVEKTPNRAGATPLFRLSAAQVNPGVAPALRHR